MQEIYSFTDLICNAANKAEYCNLLEWLEQFCATLVGKIEMNKEEWSKEIQRVDQNECRISNFIKHLNQELQDEQNLKDVYFAVLVYFNEIIESASKKTLQ